MSLWAQQVQPMLAEDNPNFTLSVFSRMPDMPNVLDFIRCSYLETTKSSWMPDLEVNEKFCIVFYDFIEVSADDLCSALFITPEVLQSILYKAKIKIDKNAIKTEEKDSKRKPYKSNEDILAKKDFRVTKEDLRSSIRKK